MNDQSPPGPNPTKTKPKCNDQLKRSAKPTRNCPHLQNKVPAVIVGVLNLKYTLHPSQTMKLRQTSIACISLMWRTCEEVEGLPGCADRPQDQRRRQKAIVGTRGCKAATASNQKKVTYQQRSSFFLWKSPEKVCQRGFVGPVMS